MADFSKSPFFKIANSQNFFMKISQIGPWVSRIDWCEGHQCSTYVSMRLSDIRAKTGLKHKKCIFCLLWICNLLYRWSLLTMFHVPLMYICVYTMYDITVYFVSENTSSQIIENGDFFAGVYESAHFSWILLVFYLMALIGCAGMIYY